MVIIEEKSRTLTSNDFISLWVSIERDIQHSFLEMKGPGVLLLWHMVGQRPAVLAAGAGRVGCFIIIIFISSIISSLSNASSLGRRLDILKYCGHGRYNPMVVVSYYWRRARYVLVNRLVGLSLPRNGVNG